MEKQKRLSQKSWVCQVELVETWFAKQSRLRQAQADIDY